MSLQYMSHDELQQFITQVDQALYNHIQWHKELIRTLVCRLPSDRHDIVGEAHKECRFGQWYYSQKAPEVLEHPGFIATGEAHQRMHSLASQLLLHSNEQRPILPLEYDHFANALEQMRLELSTLKHELEDLLYNRDTLTGTINRINMLPLLRERQETVKRLNRPCCIAMIDIDHFKEINDVHGHAVGDKVLARLARYIIEHLRPYDKVFRYGGEEFLLCIQDTELTRGFELLERLRDDIAHLDLAIKVDPPLHISVSIGLTLLSPVLSIEDSITHADQAMYAAKSAGRNRVEIAVSQDVE